jgi:glucose-6-phosphate 1-dehydrogenase
MLNMADQGSAVGDYDLSLRNEESDAVHQCVVRGQYGPGWVGGKKVTGYREEDGVSPDSQT